MIPLHVLFWILVLLTSGGVNAFRSFSPVYHQHVCACVIANDLPNHHHHNNNNNNKKQHIMISSSRRCGGICWSLVSPGRDSLEDDNVEEVNVVPMPSENLSSSYAMNNPPSSSSSSSSSSSPSTRGRTNLDPLLQSLTRMDDETIDAPRIQTPLLFPLFREVILDKSLLVLIPVATVAMVGLVLSLYVFYNAQDRFVEAIRTSASTASTSTSTSRTRTSTTNNYDDESAACRGLCSDQQQDLQRLAIYMQNLRSSSSSISSPP